jgi:hypothetical protein
VAAIKELLKRQKEEEERLRQEEEERIRKEEEAIAAAIEKVITILYIRLTYRNKSDTV